MDFRLDPDLDDLSDTERSEALERSQLLNRSGHASGDAGAQRSGNEPLFDVVGISTDEGRRLHEL